MKITETTKIATVTETKGAVSDYRKFPHHFDSAARAAIHCAKRDDKQYILIKGNSYGAFVWRIASIDESEKTYFIFEPTQGAVAKPNGDLVNCTIETASNEGA